MADYHNNCWTRKSCHNWLVQSVACKKKAIGQRICLLDHKNSMGRNCNEPKKPNTLARIQLPSPSEARFVEGKYLFRWMALPKDTAQRRSYFNVIHDVTVTANHMAFLTIRKRADQLWRRFAFWQFLHLSMLHTQFMNRLFKKTKTFFFFFWNYKGKCRRHRRRQATFKKVSDFI